MKRAKIVGAMLKGWLVLWSLVVVNYAPTYKDDNKIRIHLKSEIVPYKNLNGSKNEF